MRKVFKYVKDRGVNTLISFDPSMDAVTATIKKLGFSIVVSVKGNLGDKRKNTQDVLMDPKHD